MASSGFGLPFSNNAPQPIPGGYGNPTGANMGGYSAGSGGAPFSSLPSFGMPAYNQGPWGSGTSLQGLNTGLNSSNTSWNQNLFNELGRAYGKGTGQLLGDILSNGLFNPQVAAAFLNAQQPGIARGQASIEGAFGDAGARFSSASAIGLGDYQSQVQLNQQQTLAQLYQNAQQEQLSVLQGVLPTLHTEEANHGGGLMHDIIGGLEIAGGIGIDAFTGGLGGNQLIGLGAGTLMGGGGGQNSAMTMPGMTGGQGQPNLGDMLTKAIQSLKGQNNPVDLTGISMGGDPTGNNSAIQQIIMNMQGSGAGALGGASVTMPGTTLPGMNENWNFNGWGSDSFGG